MKEYFLRLFAYNLWANEITLDSLKKYKITDDYCLQMFSHIVNAQYIWHRRLTEQPNDYKIWDKWSIEQMQNALTENHALWQTYLNKLTPQELSRTFEYKNSAGDTFTNNVQDCLVHLINHATYHRAQVAKRLRELGFVPQNTDYITYCRLIGSKI
ncbi:MAG: DinB family protein [Microscillaceae bacterium]|nr:DinB family protein [Microscillaceae bacterium]MDW8461687.1 DinB family protein [Cytophagales bacterium]